MVQPLRLMVREDADSIITEVCSLAQIQAVCTGHNEHEAKPKWPSHRNVRLGKNRERERKKRKEHGMGIALMSVRGKIKSAVEIHRGTLIKCSFYSRFLRSLPYNYLLLQTDLLPITVLRRRTPENRPTVSPRLKMSVALILRDSSVDSDQAVGDFGCWNDGSLRWTLLCHYRLLESLQLTIKPRSQWMPPDAR